MAERIQEYFSVTAEYASKRFDHVAAELLPQYSRARIQNWIRQGCFRVNGKEAKPKDKVRVRDKLELDAELQAEGSWEAEEIPVDIVFEDDHLLVINKPADFVVHPAPGHRGGTVVNAVLNHCPELENLPRAGVVHRLDKDTTGLMVIAKSLMSHRSLVNQLQERTMGREYEAVILGELTGGGKVDAPIGRNPHNRQKMAVVANGKPAVTNYRLINRFVGLTHIRLKLETGRTHQIRVHMAHLRHPIVGDPVYGGRSRLAKGICAEAREAVLSFPRQALHARALSLCHPETGELVSWEADLPDDMKALIRALGAEDQQ